jgi:glyoxylase-like metal-dependent hydrolase (beta-lactamase superfamily II)
MFFEHVATGGCQSYLVGCADTLSAVLIDPENSQTEHCRARASRVSLHIRYVIDTHADHFFAAKQLAEMVGAQAVIHHSSPPPFASLSLDDTPLVGALRIKALHTPGHTRDFMCLEFKARVFTATHC